VALLATEDVIVRFGGLRALSEASIDVDPGRVTGLIGPNGAGKTTLFNVITGLQDPDGGRVVLDGVNITRYSPFRRARMGISRTFQKLEAFTSLSARDNVLVAAEQRKAWDRSSFSPAAVADELLERVGIVDVAHYMVGTLPTGTARLVELARALALNETAAFDDVLRRVVDERGCAVLLVEHDMSLVMGTCETIYVLEFGQMIAVGTPDEVQASKAVQAAYLGSAAVGA